jgi:hypothetical protein
MKLNRSVLAMVALLLLSASTASAESPLSASKSIRDNLKALAASKQVITVMLSNGKDYRARVGEVGDDAVILTGIVGREFFDVLIDMDEIVAIEAQARQQ